MTGFGFAPPVATPTWGVLERPDAGDASGPTIAVLYYRAQHLAGNTAYVEALCQAIEDAGGRPLPVYCASLRTAEPELLDTLGDADAMVVTVLAAGGAQARDGVGRRRRRQLERRTPCRPGYPDPAGPVPDQLRASSGRTTTTASARSTSPPRWRCPSSTAASSQSRSRSRRLTTTG